MQTHHMQDNSRDVSPPERGCLVSQLCLARGEGREEEEDGGGGGHKPRCGEFARTVSDLIKSKQVKLPGDTKPMLMKLAWEEGVEMGSIYSLSFPSLLAVLPYQRS